MSVFINYIPLLFCFFFNILQNGKMVKQVALLFFSLEALVCRANAKRVSSHLDCLIYYT